MTVIDRFYIRGVGHIPLSNFSPSPMSIKGVEWATVEHYYQAMKTLDPALREKIRQASSPGATKRLGRKVELRPDWEAVKLGVMRFALHHKFRLDNDDGRYLIGTGHALLVEGNDWGDRFWGVDGEGENWLGHLLMARRAELFAMLEDEETA